MNILNAQHKCQPKWAFYYLEALNSLIDANVAKGVFQTESRFWEEAKIIPLMSLGAGVVAEVDAKKPRDGEIEFAVIKRNKKCFAQVSYCMESEFTLNREYGACDKIRDNSPKYVICLDKKDISLFICLFLYSNRLSMFSRRLCL